VQRQRRRAATAPVVGDDETSSSGDGGRAGTRDDDGERTLTVCGMTVHVCRDACVGVGQFARVYHGRRDDGRDVALKVHKRDCKPRERAAEIEFVHRINKAGCCRYLVKVHAANMRAVVLDFLNGGTMVDLRKTLLQEARERGGRAARAARRGAIPASWALRAARHIFRALEWLHETTGIVHRDVKMANVMYDERHGVFKLCDFNLVATRTPPKHAGAVRGARKLLHTLAPPAGTPTHFSPETARDFLRAGERTSKQSWRRATASDVWAAALTVLWFLEGRDRSPFPAHPRLWLTARDFDGICTALAQLSEERALVTVRADEVGDKQARWLANALADALTPRWRDRPSAADTLETLHARAASRDPVSPRAEARARLKAGLPRMLTGGAAGGGGGTVHHVEAGGRVEIHVL
jgi:serine/threonine protein kinase